MIRVYYLEPMLWMALMIIGIGERWRILSMENSTFSLCHSGRWLIRFGTTLRTAGTTTRQNN